MAFSVYNNAKPKSIRKTEKLPPCYTVDENKTIVFPILTFNELDNVNNFTLSYYKDIDTEVDIDGISFDNGKGIQINTPSEKNGNVSNVRLFQNCFDISAEFSIKINQGTKLTNLLCFEYSPEDAVLKDFITSVGGYTYRHSGGSINCIMVDYNNQINLFPKVFGTILEPDISTSNLLQYCGKIAIDTSQLGTLDSDNLYTTDRDILLKISAFLTYIIV